MYCSATSATYLKFLALRHLSNTYFWIAIGESLNKSRDIRNPSCFREVMQLPSFCIFVRGNPLKSILKVCGMLCSPVLCLLPSLCSLAESYSVLTLLGFSCGWPDVHDLSSGWPLYSIKDGHDSLISEADSLLVQLSVFVHCQRRNWCKNITDVLIVWRPRSIRCQSYE